MIMIMDIFKKQINSRLKIIAMRFTVCLVFFLFGLCMTSQVHHYYFDCWFKSLFLNLIIFQGGFFILSLLNEYTAGYPLLIVGLLEVIVVPWVYGNNGKTYMTFILNFMNELLNNYIGTDRLIADIEAMIGKKPAWFWWIWKISWKFTCPIILFVWVLNKLKLI